MVDHAVITVRSMNGLLFKRPLNVWTLRIKFLHTDISNSPKILMQHLLCDTHVLTDLHFSFKIRARSDLIYGKRQLLSWIYF